MRSCVLTVLILTLLTAVLGAYLYLASKTAPENTFIGRVGKVLHPEPPPPPARTPESYLILEDQGGVPRSEAEQAGMVTESYAYLSELKPTNCSEGIEPASAVALGGKSYDMCFKFNTTPPEMQYLEFNLNKQWDELHFGFGFDDAHPSDPDKKWAMEYSIQADGQEVLGPLMLTPVDKPLFAKVGVSGISRISFVCRRVGYSNPFAPILVDPFVLRNSATTP